MVCPCDLNERIGGAAPNAPALVVEKLRSTCSLIFAWSARGVALLVAAFWHCKYDETPLRVRVIFQESKNVAIITTFGIFALLWPLPRVMVSQMRCEIKDEHLC